MKIIDFDCIETKANAIAVLHWLQESMVPIKTDEGVKMVPGEALYFFSTKTNPFDRATNFGMRHPQISKENYVVVDSVADLLRTMIDGINETRKKYGMPVWRKFKGRTPVVVLTNRKFMDVERAGALAMPMEILMARN